LPPIQRYTLNRNQFVYCAVRRRRSDRRARAGATGYVRKHAEPEVLLAAVRAVARGRTYIDPAVASTVLNSGAPEEELSPRETDVLRQIGRLLGKLHLENRTQAVVYALKHRLVALEELE
jgi:NarL family two-component system response regulator LiaR